jgi:hypothetical protein
MDASLRLISSRPLAGGVSAQLTAIDAQQPDGQVDRLVLRQYGAANLRTDPHEYALLSLLHRAASRCRSPVTQMSQPPPCQCLA